MMLLGSIQKNPKKTAGGLRRVGWERRRDGLQSQGTATRSAGLAGLRGPGQTPRAWPEGRQGAGRGEPLRGGWGGRRWWF